MRKVIGWIVLIILLLGSVGCVTFGIMYNNTHNELLSVNEKASQIKSLEDRILELESERLDLLESLTNLETEKANFDYEKSKLENQIELLEKQISELQQEIEYQEALLSAYENADKCTVAFYVENEFQELLLVDKNSNVDTSLISEPTKERCNFLGWAIQGTSEIIDFSTYVATSDVKFDAVFESKMDGEYTLTVSFPFIENAIKTGNNTLTANFEIAEGVLNNFDYSYTSDVDIFSDHFPAGEWDQDTYMFKNGAIQVNPFEQHQNVLTLYILDALVSVDAYVVLTFDFDTNEWTVSDEYSSSPVWTYTLEKA